MHLKNSKIYVFGDFRPDLGPKSTILALRQAPKLTPQNRIFFKLPITLAYLCRHRSKDFSQLYKVVYLNFPPFGRKIEFDKYRRFPPPTSRQYQIMADAPFSYMPVLWRGRSRSESNQRASPLYPQFTKKWHALEH